MKTHWAWVGLCSVALAAAFGAEQPPDRAGLTIKAPFSIVDLKNGDVLYTNNVVDPKTGKILHTNDVVVTDPATKPDSPPMTMSCGWLTARKSANGKIEQIVAHDRVKIDQGDTHARGSLAVYTGTNEQMVITGPFDATDPTRPFPELVHAQVTNTGTRIVYDRLQEKLFIDVASTFIPVAALQNMNKTNATNSARPPRTSPLAPRK